MKINAEWHARHKMPKNPTLDQRVKWHIEHARHCGCRPMSGKVLEEVKKRYLGTHQEFWIYYNRQDHQALASWAEECALRVLPLFEGKFPTDPRPRQALVTLHDWIESGEFHMSAIRRASLAAHAAAREVPPGNNAAVFAARAAGQAVATAHVPTHALGSALYAIKAIAAANPGKAEAAVAHEHEWQLAHLPDNLREWVIAGLKQNQRLLPPQLRS